MPNLRNEAVAIAEGTNGAAAAPVQIKPPTRVAIKDAKGNIIGYNVTTYNADGSIASVTPEIGTAQEDAVAKQSAYDMLTLELNNLGLASLVGPLKKLFQEGISDGDTLRLKLSETPEYQARFSANKDRIAKGLAALSPAEYIALEDQYQNIMRNYGLPASYYTKDATGKQAGFDQLLANDVSAVELEDRVTTAQQRVLNANPEVLGSLKQFYGDVIDKGDILAYALDPQKALTDIKRKVTAAEIGGAAAQAGLGQTKTSAEALAAAGVTGQQYQQQAGTIAELTNRGGMLASIYNQAPYGQTQAEAEVFNVAGQTEAAAQRKKITGLEKAAFSGSAGTAKTALERDRANAAGAI